DWDKYRGTKLELRLGDIYQNAGKRKLALKTYRGILPRVGSGSWLEKEVLAQIEHLYRREDDLTGLRDELTGMIKDHAKRVALLKRQATLLAELGETDKAKEAYLALLKVTPGDRPTREHFIQFLTKAEQYEEAEKQVNALQTAHPNDLELLLLAASIHNGADKKKEVTETLKTYLKRSEKKEFTYLRVARLFTSYKLPKAATAVYTQLSEAFPASLTAQEALAAHLFATEEKEKAVALFLTMAKSDELDTVLRVIRSLKSRFLNKEAYRLVSERKGDFSDSLAFLRTAVQLAAGEEQKEEALAFARQALSLVTQVSELEPVLADAVRCIRTAGTAPAVIKELVESETRSIPQTCLLAELQLLDAGPEISAKTLDTAIAAGEKLDFLYSQKLRLAKRLKEWDKAIATTEALLKLRPAHRTLYSRQLAELCVQSQQYTKALHWIEEWKKASPSSTQPYLQEARIQGRQGSAADVTAVLRKACLKFPDNVDLQQQLGSSYAEAGQYGDATRIYWSLLEKNTTLAGRMRYVTDLMTLAQIQGSTERLIRHFISRAEANPKSVFPLLALASIHRGQGDYEKRRHYLIKATELRTEDVSLLHEIARMESEEGDTERAINTLRKAAVKDKTTASRERLMREYFNNGEEEQGYRLLLDLKGGKTMDASSFEEILTTLIVNRQFDYATPLLQETAGRFTDNYRITLLKGILFEEGERYREAIDQFLLALTLRTELPSAAKRKPKRLNPYRRMGNYTDLLPKEAVSLFKTQQVRYQLYRHRQPRNRYSYHHYSPFSSQTGRIALPASLEEVESYVTGHLATISQLLEEEEQKALQLRLEESGVAYAKLKLLLTGRTYLRNLPLLDEMMKSDEHKDDLGLASVWLTNRMHTPGADPALLKRAFDALKKDYPDLAVMAGLRSLHRSSGEEPKKAIGEEALTLLEAMEKPNPFALQGLMGLASPRAQVTPEQKKRIRDLMLKLYTLFKDDPNFVQPHLKSGLVMGV
ncbi:MAG: tetratricopeptide repeat protein, partial [Planctomycetota bacterium]